MSSIVRFENAVLFVSTTCHAIESIEEPLADCIVETVNCQLRHLLKHKTTLKRNPKSRINMKNTAHAVGLRGEGSNMLNLSSFRNRLGFPKLS